jgi:endoglucanase
VGDRKAVVILEPDALSLDCLYEDSVDLLSEAVTILKSKSEIAVYIDAGHFNWIDSTEMATRLTNANVENADGFALNVSNFYTTAENVEYGEAISALIGDKHFVIDTSRNGNGSNGEWCNPSGMSLGQNPTTDTGYELVDAFLWVKPPGQSDGTCNGGPSAGTWWAEYALDLVRN